MNDYEHEEYIDIAEVCILVPNDKKKKVKVFFDEDRADAYLECHDGYKKIMQKTSDYEEYTPFCIVEVKDCVHDVGYCPTADRTIPKVAFKNLCLEEDAKYHIEDNEVKIGKYYMSEDTKGDSNIYIYMRRVVPLDCDEKKVADKITQFLNDLFAEAVYMLHEGGWDDEECMKEAREGTEAHVRERLNEFKL